LPAICAEDAARKGLGDQIAVSKYLDDEFVGVFRSALVWPALIISFFLASRSLHKVTLILLG